MYACSKRIILIYDSVYDLVSPYLPPALFVLLALSFPSGKRQQIKMMMDSVDFGGCFSTNLLHMKICPIDKVFLLWLVLGYSGHSV